MKLTKLLKEIKIVSGPPYKDKFTKEDIGLYTYIFQGESSVSEYVDYGSSINLMKWNDEYLTFIPSGDVYGEDYTNRLFPIEYFQYVKQDKWFDNWEGIDAADLLKWPIKIIK